MQTSLFVLLRNLIEDTPKKMQICNKYIYRAYKESEGKLIFSSRNSLFKDGTAEEVFKNTKRAVLKLSVISCKIENGHAYIRLDV